MTAGSDTADENEIEYDDEEDIEEDEDSDEEDQIQSVRLLKLVFNMSTHERMQCFRQDQRKKTRIHLRHLPSPGSRSDSSYLLSPARIRHLLQPPRNAILLDYP